MRLLKDGNGISGRRVSRLVVSLLVALFLLGGVAQAANTGGTWQWRDKITYAGAVHDVPPGLIQAVMAVESGGDPQAHGGAGAIGLMQVIPSWFNSGEDAWNPDTNINKATQILRRCEDQAGGWHPGDDWSRALTCYNTGSVNGHAPGYVSKVHAAWRALAAEGA